MSEARAAARKVSRARPRRRTPRLSTRGGGACAAAPRQIRNSPSLRRASDENGSGLLGCGTVGGGVIQLLHGNAGYLASRVGAPIEVARVLVRAPERERVPQLD